MQWTPGWASASLASDILDIRECLFAVWGGRALPMAWQEQVIHLPQQKWRQATSCRALDLGFHQTRFPLARIESGAVRPPGLVSGIREQQMHGVFSAHNAFHHPIANSSNIIYLNSQLSLDQQGPLQWPQSSWLLRSCRKFRRPFLTNASVKVTEC